MVVLVYNRHVIGRCSVKLIKKILALWLVIYLVIVPPVAHATSPGGWAMTAFNLPTMTINAVKNGLATSATISSINSAGVASVLAKTAASVAIAYAIAKYGGQAIDWILDPANNTLKRKATYAGGDTVCKNKDNGQSISASAFCSSKGSTFREITPAGQVSCNGTVWGALECPTSGSPELVVPVNDIVPDVIQGAKNGDAAAQNVINQAVAESVNAGTYDKTLDDAAQKSCAQGTSWNGSACVATQEQPTDRTGIESLLQSIQSILQGLASAIVNPIVDAIELAQATIKDFWQWIVDTYTAAKTEIVNKYNEVENAVVTEYKEVRDWVYSEDDLANMQNEKPVDVPEADTTLKDPADFDKDYISVTAQCPADVERQIPVGQMSFSLVFQMSPMCDFLDTYMRPVIILMAYIIAASSIGNAFKIGG